MKRLIRILVLSGMVAVWVLTFRSQSAQAIVNSPKPDSGKYKTTLYYGVYHIGYLISRKIKGAILY